MNAANTFVPIATAPILIAICGPTASGKSGLAMKLADRLPAVILSADSRQVYREFNIGTAKPSWNDRQRVPHYLIDICDPTETLTLADYQAQAQALIEKLHQGEGPEKAIPPHSTAVQKQATAQPTGTLLANRPQPSLHPLSHPWETLSANILHPSAFPLPLLVGGTGLYVKSIARGLRIPRVAPQPALRVQLQALGQPQCYAFLQRVDAAAAEKIHPHDQVRTLRALEVFYVTGRPISQQQGECPPSYPILHIGLDCAAAGGLTRRIEQRTAEMMAAGFVAEVQQLCEKYGTGLPLLDTLGYREVTQYLMSEISLVQAEALTVLHTRQFAKRQRTWFRADRTIEWFDADAPDLLEQVWQRVQQFIAEAQNHSVATEFSRVDSCL